MIPKILIILLIAHIIGDFYLQTNKACRDKKEKKIKSLSLYWHSALISILSICMIPTLSFFYYAIAIFITHILIDLIKSYSKQGLASFIIDQFLHIFLTTIIAYLYGKSHELPFFDDLYFKGMYVPSAILAILFLCKPTNILIKEFLRSYKIGLNESNSIRIGGLIGSLERLLTLLFVALGQYETIGFIVAAKSILRFKDTDTSKSEYVLAGSLLSFGTALFVSCFLKYISI